MNVVLLHNNHGHVSATHTAGHLQSGENKNTITIMIRQSHSTV